MVTRQEDLKKILSELVTPVARLMASISYFLWLVMHPAELRCTRC